MTKFEIIYICKTVLTLGVFALIIFTNQPLWFLATIIIWIGVDDYKDE